MLVTVPLFDATAIATDTTTVDSTVDLCKRAGTCVGSAATLTAYSAGDFTCAVETSLDGSTWRTLVAGTVHAAAGVFFDAVGTTPPDAFRYVRASILSATSADATVEMTLLLSNS